MAPEAPLGGARGPPPQAGPPAAAPRRAKRKRPRPPGPPPAAVHCDGWWGLVCEDVSACVDFAVLQASLDAVTAPRLWALSLTQAALAEQLRLPLRVEAGSRQPLSEACGLANDAAPAPQQEPASAPSFALSARAALRPLPGKGRGWVATAPLPAGAVVLVERPVVATLDAEWRGEAWAECASADTAALGVRLAQALSPSLLRLLAALHPKEGARLPELLADSEDESNEEAAEAAAALAADVESAWREVRVDGVHLDASAKERLKMVVRLNSLGFYTQSEQLCHHGGFSALTGSGLYALGSGFNHSCEPSVARWSVGDVTIFVTNRPVAAGEELCISYIETELLCASRTSRGRALSRDFACACNRCSPGPPSVAAAAEVGAGAEAGPGKRYLHVDPTVQESEGKRYLHVDATVQAELSLLPPGERVAAVEAALRGEVGGTGSEDEDENEDEEREAQPVVLLGKDAQELRVVQALALMQLGRYAEAIAVWRRLAAFTTAHCPPFDEALAVYATQAALCALAGRGASEQRRSGSASSSCSGAGAVGEAAEKYAASALVAHRAACGVGGLYRGRYRQEVALASVPEGAKAQFWEFVDRAAAREAQGAAPVPAWSDFVAAWDFHPEEVPEAVTGDAAGAPAAALVPAAAPVPSGAP